MGLLDIAAILRSAPPAEAAPTLVPTILGASREGRDLRGYTVGRGPRHVSLIAGCHADEPVGPAMLDRLVSWLASLPADSALLGDFSFRIVPHVNPDGEARNAAWAGERAARAAPGTYDLGAYLQGAVREPPGDDVEFGFPKSPEDTGARPENRAVAAFLAADGPYVLHASFHGMAFAAGPWFLMEAGWAERSGTMRQRLREEVGRLGYETHDVDRGGEKGFTRIDEGFTTRPDSRAMIEYFRALGDETMAALFRPSSMEYVCSLGGDPLTLVSEMPLFLLPRHHFQGPGLVRPEAVFELRHLAGDAPALAAAAARHGVRPMPILDQMALQLSFLDEGLSEVLSS